MTGLSLGTLWDRYRRAQGEVNRLEALCQGGGLPNSRKYATEYFRWRKEEQELECAITQRIEEIEG